MIAHATSLPGAVMTRRWGETLFRVRHRVFAFLSMNAVPSVTVKVEDAARERALTRPDVRRARYIGRLGWATVRVADDDSFLVACELITMSYALAVRRL